MRRILIAKDVPLSQNKDISGLSAGQIGLFGMGKNDYLFQPVGTGSVLTWFQVYLGGGDLPSDVIDINPRQIRLVKAPYKKAVKPVYEASIDHYGSSSYDEFVLSISEIRIDGMEFVAEKISVTGGFGSALDLYKALADKVNAESLVATAIGTGAGVQITAKEEGYDMIVGMAFVKDETDKCNPCVCYNVCVKQIVEFNAGSGSCKHIQRLDYQFRPHKGGYGAYMDAITPSPSIFGTCEDCSKAEFDLYMISPYSNQHHAENDNGREAFKMEHELIVAFPKGSVGGNEYEMLVETLLGTQFIHSPIS